LAGRGEISFPALLISAWIGAVTGDNIGYLIGRKLGHKALLRFGGMVGLTADRLRKMEAIFVRYGALTVAFARFFNILRQLNGVVAGSLEMDWRRFLVFNSLGGALCEAVFRHQVLDWGRRAPRSRVAARCRGKPLSGWHRLSQFWF
jgi:membrane protein DedA with SNARE-associated domain